MTRRAMAVAAHPDDIEFAMAGTLVLLGRAGYALHYMTVANGSCGTQEHSRDAIIRIREAEARAAAATLGAQFHPSLTDDLAIFYEPTLLARLAAVIRAVAPQILLVPSPVDYMEDHQNAARLAVTAAFARGMPNYETEPPRDPIAGDVTVYHAQPHGNCDPLGGPVVPGYYVDVEYVMEIKRTALAQHASQRTWLDASQGMGSYIGAMEEMGRVVGAMSGRYEYAEGWRRRLHYGLCAADADPLADALGARGHHSR